MIKHLTLVALVLTACGAPPKTTMPYNTSIMPATSQTPTPSTLTPIDPITLVPSPSPSPTATPCKGLTTSTWTNASTGMIDTITGGAFTIVYNSMSCHRLIADGVANGGDPTSLIFNDTCYLVPIWIQFYTRVCNQLTVVIRDGLGQVLETEEFN